MNKILSPMSLLLKAGLTYKDFLRMNPEAIKIIEKCCAELEQKSLEAENKIESEKYLSIVKEWLYKLNSIYNSMSKTLETKEEQKKRLDNFLK